MARVQPKLAIALLLGFSLGQLTTLHATPNAPPGSAGCCAIVELRQYLLHSNQRDALIELFDREFVESQEATGMTVMGQFRDLDHPDHFVWLRGFPDMPARAASLTAFYQGPVWRTHSKAANATMIDSDNVLLLEPAGSETQNVALPSRSARGAASVEKRLIVATIYYLKPEATAGFAEFFAHRLSPSLAASGAAILGAYSTSKHANNFPGLPVREGEHAFLWLGKFENAAGYEFFQAALARDARWRGAMQELEARLDRPSETLRLAPTLRSRL